MKKNIILLVILNSLAICLYGQEETTYWDNGNLRNVSNYKNGEKEGVNKDYYQNGQLQEIGNYSNGEKNGEWKEYYRMAQLKGIAYYKNGSLHGERKDYHKNGKLSYIANYNNGLSIGESTEYDENGTIQRIITYKNGEFYKSDNKKRRLVEFETFSIDSVSREKIKKNTVNYLSRTDLIIKIEKKSNYSYAFGLKEKLFNNKLVKSLTILLLNDNEVVSEISYNIDFEFKTIFNTNSLKGFNIVGVEDALEIGFGRGACGYGYHEVIFFRNKNQLVKGLLVSSYGEVESGYSTKKIIAPLHKEENQIWVKKSIGHSEFKNDEYTEVNYFTEIEKYTFQNSKFVLMNPEKDNFYYVTAQSGLRQRYRPFATSDTLSLLKYGTKVKLLNKTNLEFKANENGKIIKGHWVQIEVDDNSENKYTSYVFDGYLSRTVTTIEKAELTNNKDGKWKWYYENGQLGELGFYKNGNKEGKWEWYFKNGALKALGNYKSGKPEGTRKWYFNNDELYCLGQFSNGKKDGEWLWYYNDKPRLSIIFENDTVVEYKVLDNQKKVILKTKSIGISKVDFYEPYDYRNVFEVRIKNQEGYNISFVNDYITIGKRKNNEATGEWKTYHSNGMLNKINNYKNGKLNGIFKYFNLKEVLIYSWNYIDGKKTGEYNYYYDNGQLENSGNLENGLQVGIWKMYDENGQIENSRHYTNGKYDGIYIDYYTNGKVKEERNYRNGNKEGIWKAYYENGALKEITPYKNDKIHGDWTKYDEKGILKESIHMEHGDFTKLQEIHYYTNGQIRKTGFTNNDVSKYGIWKEFYEDGKLKEVNHYLDGKEDGEWIQYYNNGQIKVQGQHIKGERNGKFIWYKEDGRIKEATEYNYPNVIGKWKYYDNGQLESVELYNRKKLVEWKYYYDNGQLKELRQYQNKGKETGEWKYYYKNGTLRLLAQYKDGIRSGEWKLYHNNGQLYKTEQWGSNYYHKLMEINSCFDSKGNALDKGTLEKGTGTVKEYNAKGELINIVAYKEGEKIGHNISLDAVWNDSDELNSLAWKYFEEENSTIKLNWAVKWVQHSIELDENYHNTDTYAALLYKIGKYKKALKIAKNAIRIAKKTKIKFKVTKELIEKIKTKLN